MSKHIVSPKGGAMPAEGYKTRRAALGALASALVVPNVGAMPSSVDPIFAAIERHRSTWAAVEAMAPIVDEVAAIREDREITQADWEASERGSAMEEQALNALLIIAPTTAAGMRAAIQCLVGYDDGRLPENIGQFLATLLKSPLFVGDARR